jgi:hypothetical protein
MRLAEEYDAAQERGEVQRAGGDRRSIVAVHNNDPTTAEIGLRRDEIHEARKLRDAEARDPGLIRRAIDNIVERGEEPTRAALHREIVGRSAPSRPMDPQALWVWVRISANLAKLAMTVAEGLAPAVAEPRTWACNSGPRSFAATARATAVSSSAAGMRQSRAPRATPVSISAAVT